MKQAVSISLGSSRRNKAVDIEMLGEQVHIERIGMDGDMDAAAQKFKELDGEVDAFGVGGADLGVMVDGRWYPLHSVQPMIRFVEKTPVVDGTGIKNTLEGQTAGFIEDEIGAAVNPKHAFLTLGADRWGMTESFIEAEYDVVFGDLMFGLGLPFALHSTSAVKRTAALLMPIAGRLPFEMVYPTGESQDKREPKYEEYYAWASVIAGDCHYIKRHMPENLDGKVIATNTTTEADVAEFRQAGVRYLVTVTPVLDGRSFGANMMEAALVAIAGKGRALTNEELADLLTELQFKPQLQTLN